MKVLWDPTTTLYVNILAIDCQIAKASCFDFLYILTMTKQQVIVVKYFSWPSSAFTNCTKSLEGNHESDSRKTFGHMCVNHSSLERKQGAKQNCLMKFLQRIFCWVGLNFF